MWFDTFSALEVSLSRGAIAVFDLEPLIMKPKQHIQPTDVICSGGNCGRKASEKKKSSLASKSVRINKWDFKSLNPECTLYGFTISDLSNLSVYLHISIFIFFLHRDIIMQFPPPPNIVYWALVRTAGWYLKQELLHCLVTHQVSSSRQHMCSLYIHVHAFCITAAIR